MPTIRISEAPTGAAIPRELREAWRGIEIPLPTADDFRKNPPVSRFSVSSLATRDHLVLKEAAAKALEAAGKSQAADFLRKFPSGRYLSVPKDKCELISE